MQAKHLPLGRPEAERLKCRYDQLGLGFNKGQREPTLEVVQGRVELCLPFLTHLCLPQCMTEEFKSSLLHLPASFCFGIKYPEIVGRKIL